MDYVQPYGVDDPNAAYVDGNRLAGITGSRIRASSYEMMLRELRQLVVAAGLEPNVGDWTQVAAAVIAMHRITETQTLIVPGDFEDLYQATEFLSCKIIPSDVKVTIAITEDQHLDTSTGPVVLNHPYGSQIYIRGKDLTASFPTYLGGLNSDTYKNSAAQTETYLRGIFPTRIVVAGSIKAALFMTGGMLGGVENLLFIGDKSANQHGVLIGDWQNQIGTGNIRLAQVWFHNFGVDGLRVNFNSAVQAYRLGASHCNGNGIRVANQSGMQVIDSVVCVYNAYDGVTITDNSFFEIFTGSGDVHKNGGNGIGCDCGSNLQTTGATIIRGAQNGAYGILVSDGASAIIKAPSLAGNVIADICAQVRAIVHVYAVPFDEPTYSPAVNTLGNVQAYIYRH